MRRRRCNKRRMDFEVLTGKQEYDLRAGACFFRDTWGNGTDEERQANRRGAWKRFRAAILAKWMADNPGTRPAAWWQYDAPEPWRRRIGGGLASNEDPSAPDWIRNAGPSFGLPKYASNDPSNGPIFETEHAYLKRHNLLTADEAKALAAQDPICILTRAYARETLR